MDVTSSALPTEMVTETRPECDHATLLPTALHGSLVPLGEVCILDWHSVPRVHGFLECAMLLPSRPWHSAYLIPSSALSSPPPGSLPAPQGQVRYLLWAPAALPHHHLPISDDADYNYFSVASWGFLRARDTQFCLRLKILGLDTYRYPVNIGQMNKSIAIIFEQ